MEKVKELILTKLPDIVEITFSKIPKTNGITYPTCIIKDNLNSTAISKVIYYDENKTEEEIAANIIKAYLNDKPSNINIDNITKIFSDKNLFLSRVKPMIINYRYNRSILTDIGLYKRIKEDLAIIYYIDLGYGITKVKESNIMKLGLTVNTINYHAIKNIDYTIQLISNVVNLPKEFCSRDIYVVSNKNSQFGASSILSFKCMNKVRELYGGKSFFILPSSIHEVICVPIDEEDGKQIHKLREMVKEVNSTVLNAEDFLSNSIFLYREYSLVKI